jgi:hypothetical protein
MMCYGRVVRVDFVGVSELWVRSGKGNYERTIE